LSRSCCQALTSLLPTLFRKMTNQGPSRLPYSYLPQFINESLEELSAALQQLGGSLVVRHGEMTEVLAALSAELAPVGGIAQLLSHQETGTPATVARNAAVAQWAQQNGVEWRELPQTGAAIKGCRLMDDCLLVRTTQLHLLVAH